MRFAQSSNMDTDITPCRFYSKHYLTDMPENIWLEIFSFLTLEEKFKAAGTCRTWHRILADPSLYTHITLDNMEFNTLVLCMQQLCRLAPRMRSLCISNCYSSFISKTTVPIQNTAIMHHFPQQPGMHSLYSHITSFTLPRRREEYRKLGFTLHQDFSRALITLMEQSQETIKSLDIHDNFLDLEMTELIFSIVRNGRHLENLLYDRNRDDGFFSPEIVSAITAACPNIKSFRGHHGISDTVLRRMMTGWKDLRSMTLAPYQAQAVGTKEVSMEGLWSLLECGTIESLELLDLDCVSNDNVHIMVQRVKQLQATSFERTASSPLSHPFAHHHSYFATLPPTTLANPLPGKSVRHLTITKYTSSPLTLPGFRAILKLFPNLESFKFTTNFFTYHHQFQGLTKEIYEEEIVLVERMIRAEMTERWGNARAAYSWQGEWDASVTQEQLLRASIMRSG
ncbi:hypothetical protein BC939DRAFT_528552 [Gamsiella multidivaricata]|uniref:uncharacterized protein n=1 Tax=Gamsiella multidivaricata TaxID=101098 RepID=UPI00221F8EB1|nr:uncharacterized protein BC939DRAFT_528552 [Gamsiella multidivaricata]KAG0365150.1 hypothetical protein BGZ54_006823 [Gamsiella multidivaricata]KAI7824351.1 hypothetical protein BC939DRAFT_528552 [Gamsiella multidivaricata]